METKHQDSLKEDILMLQIGLEFQVVQLISRCKEHNVKECDHLQFFGFDKQSHVSKIVGVWKLSRLSLHLRSTFFGSNSDFTNYQKPISVPLEFRNVGSTVW